MRTGDKVSAKKSIWRKRLRSLTVRLSLSITGELHQGEPGVKSQYLHGQTAAQREVAAPPIWRLGSLINYKSYYDLSRDITANIAKIPQVDVVAGVPKSGMIPAAMIASFLNVQLLDLDSLIFIYSTRSGVRKQRNDATRSHRVLIVDDSINTGAEFTRVRERLKHVAGDVSFVFCAVYGLSPSGQDSVADVVLSILPQPRIFQWNYRNHAIAEHSCFDLDGVLCVDPTDEENDDGEKYRTFLKNAIPLYLPRKPISAIVTSRLEKFRPETEQWLAHTGIRYKDLIMLDLPSASERRRLRAHASFKAEVYKSRGEILFVESNWKQAKEIASLADKPVICTLNDAFLYGRDHINSIQLAERDYSPENINEASQLRQKIGLLKQQLERLHPDISREVYAYENRSGKPHRQIHPINRERIIEKHSLKSAQRSPSSDGRRLLMISTTFDKRKGAGAAVSSGRLRDALRQEGWDVATIGLENFTENEPRGLDQPVGGQKIAFWNSYHNPKHSRSLLQKVDEVNPDVIILGAVDRGIMSMFDVARLEYPIVWIGRDNWIHTGGCLFKLPQEQVSMPPLGGEKFFSSLTCDKYLTSCTECPALSTGEQAKAELQYEIKRSVLQYRKDIVFAPISDWFASILARAPLTASHTIERVYNAIDLNEIRPLKEGRDYWRRKLELPLGKKLVLLAAHNLGNQRKGVGVLFDALKVDPLPEDVQLVLVGEVNAKQLPSSVQKSAIRLGFIESTEQMVELYNSVDLTLVPTLQETLSVVASDSIACGVPVVAFRTSGITDYVFHKTNGYLAEPFDGRDLLEGVKWVLSRTPPEISSLRECARRTAQEKFCRRTNATHLGALISRAKEQYQNLEGYPLELEKLEKAFGLIHLDNLARRRHYTRTGVEVGNSNNNDRNNRGDGSKKNNTNNKKRKNLFQRLSHSVSKRLKRWAPTSKAQSAWQGVRNGERWNRSSPSMAPIAKLGASTSKSEPDQM